MLTFIAYPKCSTCRRAKAELQELGLDFEERDIVTQTPKAEELLAWLKAGEFPIKAFFNTSGQSYRALGLKDKVADLQAEEAARLLASDGMLIKRPLLVKDGQLLQIGHRKSYDALNL
ncbi:arsenate reductase family protein [Streptococcus sp. DD12]|uniref:arsenate reductase family protein n=1 Tax=Streptococcus sp. DD12 TaxID=1777880 RepID=UPI00082C567D|nr:arsenate reductase family protein [Streptococcus sp. DD12]